MKSTLKFLIFFLVPVFTQAQVFSTVSSDITIHDGIYTDIDSCFVVFPPNTQVNYRFGYFSQNGDTTYTSTQTYLSFGIYYHLMVDNLVVNCNTPWTGFFEAWVVGGQNVTQSDDISWSLPCAGNVSVSYSVEEVIGVGVVISFPYNSGFVNATLYYETSVGGQSNQPNTVVVNGEDVFIDTLLVSAGQSYQICDIQINNWQSPPIFLPGCTNGVMDSFVPSPPSVELIASVVNNDGEISVYVENSGNSSASFIITMQKMLCDGSYENFFTHELVLNQLFTDTTFVLPVPANLPFAPGWRFIISGGNGLYDIIPQVVDVNVAVGLTPTVTLALNSLGGGQYEAVSVWNDFGAGNVVLSYYVNDQLVGTLQPTTSPVTYDLPTFISSYSGALVEVVLTSNACTNAVAIQNISPCNLSQPVHTLQEATNVTAVSANVQITNVSFGNCADVAMVGVVLIGVDTLWLNATNSSNYNFQFTGLQPGQSYFYTGILYADGQYFTSPFSLTFTTLTPHFTNFNVNWDQNFMLITPFVHYDLEGLGSVGLRIFHDGPTTPAIPILNATVSDDFTSFDHPVTGQYGTHIVWAELYNTQTNVIYETTDPAMITFQQTVDVTELGRPIERFNSVSVYDLSSRQVAVFSQGDMLSPELPVGIYIFVGRKEGEVVSSKIYLQ